ncbi:DUF6415 family natural product biosynthesis protein [Streptomyces sp. NPDC094149]|uniref:DUF6415 family natural product biosynthesis protein n=1 Tax=Streptomyces sp. NPDC094149 TaxID=3155079 RepID=UPI00332EF204
MDQSTEPPGTRQTLDDLIAEGLAATGILPTIDRCKQLRDDLVREVRPLIDEVRQQQSYLPAHTIDWQRCETALLQAQAALCGGLGLGLRSAALHVHTLAEAAHALRGAIRETA